MAHLIIAGAGAAGLFAAGRALELGHRVTLVEHMDRPGKKLLITGKGRCNLTNACDEGTFLQNVRANPRFLYSALYALPPAALMELFEARLGVPLKVERGRRVFPVSDDARQVLGALQAWARGAALVKGRATGLLQKEGRATGLALEDGRRLLADAVLVATGGLSYPVTGSTGLGYTLARQAGHAIRRPQPSLVALKVKDAPRLVRPAAGLSLRNVNLRLLEDGKALFSEQGELLFTHFGLSGPLTLSASAYIGDLAAHSYTLSIDLKPALNEDTLDARLQRDFAAMAGREAAHCLDKLLPASLRPLMLARWAELEGGARIDPRQRVNQITREQRRALVSLVKDFAFTVAARGDLDHAVITAGGVMVDGVNPKTMESRLLPGLYFAGEVLDLDAYTGGYNLHIAWCTANACAQAL